MLGNGVPEQSRGACERKQCEGMTETPCQTMLDDIAGTGLAGGDT